MAMNWQQFKHLFAKTRRPYDSELWQAKDGVLSCPACDSLNIVVSDTPDSFAYGHCRDCKTTDNLNQFSIGGLADRYKVAGKQLPVECPECGAGSNLVVRNGRYGLFIGCNRYPGCNYLVNVREETSTRVEL